MATIEEGLKSFIEANAHSAGNGYPLIVPEGQSGWAYQRIPNEGEQLAHDGPTGFVKVRFQITVIGSGETTELGYTDAKAKANAIHDALHGYKGFMGDVKVEYCKVASIDDELAQSLKLAVQRLDVALNYLK